MIPDIKIIGVGGSGCSTITHIYDLGLKGVELICINTDEQSLCVSRAHSKVQIGKDITEGLGAGSEPIIGKIAAEVSKKEIRRTLLGADLLFITTGLGGGTGTGAGPVVAQMARESGLLTIAVVTIPFSFEGPKPKKTASESIGHWYSNVDSLIIIPSERFRALAGGRELPSTYPDIANEVLKWVIKGLSYPLVQPGKVKIDFTDVRRVMRNRGFAIVGTAIISGSIVDAALSMLDYPLTEKLTPNNNQDVFVSIIGGMEPEIEDIKRIEGGFRKKLSEDSMIVVGTAINSQLKDKKRVMVMGTGFSETSYYQT